MNDSLRRWLRRVRERWSRLTDDLRVSMAKLAAQEWAFQPIALPEAVRAARRVLPAAVAITALLAIVWLVLA